MKFLKSYIKWHNWLPKWSLETVGLFLIWHYSLTLSWPERSVYKWVTLHMGHSSEALQSVLTCSLEGCTLPVLPFWSLLVQALYPGECLESIKVGEAPVYQSVLAISTWLVNLEVWSDGESNPRTCLFFEIIHQQWALAHRWIPHLSLCLRPYEVYLLLPWHLCVPKTYGDKMDV